MNARQRVRIAERLAASRDAGLYCYDLPLKRAGKNHVLVGGERLFLASSYDYLSLIGEPSIEAAAIAAIKASGTATGGVRLLTGTVAEHRRLEEGIATFYRTDTAVTFSSGYFANIGAMAAFGGPGVTAYVDAFAHRSILDACVLAGSQVRRFRHNDPGHLSKLLSERPAQSSAVIFVETIYSMDGDLAPLARISQIATTHGVPLLVDDAHGLGVLDRDRHPGVAVWTGALSKAVPSNGGFAATNEATADCIRHVAGPYIFSAAAAPPIVAAAIQALTLIEKHAWRRTALRSNIAKFAAELGDANAHDARSPIFPIRFADDAQTLRAAAALRSAGILAMPIVAPAVGTHQPRLRICVNAAHESDDLSRLAAAIRKIQERDGISRIRDQSPDPESQAAEPRYA